MKHILLIEDDLSIAELQRDYLEIGGMTVTICQNGEEGVALALKGSFDLIVLDIMLPKIDGFEVCKQIREVKDIPIMMVSARKEEIDKVRGLGLGADDYMTKPFSPSELVARVKAHLTRYERLTQKVTSQLLEIGVIRVDKDAHKVFIQEEEQLFTTKEFELLVFLMEHPNRVWSKEQLFEKVWEMSVFSGEVSTVVVHIKKIREKIKQKEDDHIFIETIWGSGYRFNR